MSDIAAQTASVQARIAAARALCTRLGSTTQLAVTLPEDEAAKADFLDRSGRPFFAVTPELQRVVGDAMQERIEDVYTGGEGVAAVAEIFAVGAAAARAHFVDRFEKQGVDVTLTAITAAYRAWKVAHGLSGLVGIATRHLIDAVRVARVEFR